METHKAFQKCFDDVRHWVQSVREELDRTGDCTGDIQTIQTRVKKLEVSLKYEN